MHAGRGMVNGWTSFATRPCPTPRGPRVGSVRRAADKVLVLRGYRTLHQTVVDLVNLRAAAGVRVGLHPLANTLLSQCVAGITDLGNGSRCAPG